MIAASLTRLSAGLGVALVLVGCQSIREATGVAKLPPDEFTVLTKAPLIIPPDFNLRPPQPGIGSRNEIAAGEQARALLFPQNAAAQAQALGTAFSEGEKLLLARSNALAVDPNIRRTIRADAGQEDLGPDFAQRLLFAPNSATAAAAPVVSAAAPPVNAAQAVAPRAP
jgi:Protein of unknown function (DUF3035)